jgi:hypothetical protein
MTGFSFPASISSLRKIRFSVFGVATPPRALLEMDVVSWVVEEALVEHTRVHRKRDHELVDIGNEFFGPATVLKVFLTEP